VSKYELEFAEDDDARVVANAIEELQGDGAFSVHTQQLLTQVREALRAQIPIPVPNKIGAVVRTEHPTLGGYYLRWSHDNATHSPWIQVGNHEEPYRTDQIGRITEVLSEGADL
jgi:hypothetical protein